MHLTALLALAPFIFHSSLALLIDREFPHLIVPLHQDNPATAYGTQYSGNIQIQDGAHQVYTEISFDVPSNAAGLCMLDFTIATNGPSGPGGPWTLSGTPPFTFNVSTLSPSMNQSRDAWDASTRPVVQDHIATVQVNYDGTVAVTGGEVECAKGSVAQFLLYPGSGRNLGLTWFEEANPIHGITYAMYD